ncbi:MAG: hypothetical protein GY820_19990, partial [Gammaproteobacteria bacterium]|nr:hypothetical protein [Gammaproteobacteria bacterium]
EEIKQLTQLLAEEREENRREKAEKDAKRVDEQCQTMKRLQDFTTRAQEVCDQLRAERIQSKDPAAQQEEVIEALQARLNRIEKDAQDHQDRGSVTKRGIDSALERTSRMLSNVPRNLLRLGRTNSIERDRTPSVSESRRSKCAESQREREVNLEPSKTRPSSRDKRMGESSNSGNSDSSSGEYATAKDQREAERTERRKRRERKRLEKDHERTDRRHQREARSEREARDKARKRGELRDNERPSANLKIPRFLCDKFGDKPTQDFETFEREFRDVCDLYSVPEEQKVQRLKSHLEGSVLVHANSWIDAQGDQEYTYRGLVKELRFQFQKSVRE